MLAQASFAVCIDIINSLLDGRNFLGFLVRNLTFKLFFERHYEFNRIERIGAKIVDEGGAVSNVVFVYPQLLNNNLLNALLNVVHSEIILYWMNE
jgi:hypothetical protein